MNTHLRINKNQSLMLEEEKGSGQECSFVELYR